MTDQPVEPVEEPTGDEPSVVPNRAERRGRGKKAGPISKIPGQPHNANVIRQRQFNNRRGG